MSIHKLFDLLEKHDWYYAMSDDHRCWKRGEAERKEIEALASQTAIGAETYQGFKDHWFRGEPWGNESRPLPIRPTRYALFDERNDQYISLGLFDTDGDAHIAASEHGLPEDGTDYYVAPAIQTMEGMTLTYEPGEDS